MNSYSGKRNRRKQHGRAPLSHLPRRKHKKPPSLDIEEQLRVQRKKRALEDKTAQRQQPLTLGNYRYDAERKAYFPSESFPRDNKQRPARQLIQQKQRNHVQCSNTRQSLVPETTSFQSLTNAMDISNFPKRQHDLRSLWAARLVRMGMQVVPTWSLSADGSRLQSMLPSLKRQVDVDTGGEPHETTTTTTLLDLVCKTRLHPSARTFDVHKGSDCTLLPSIATLVDGGSHVWFAHQPQVWTVQEHEQQAHVHDANSLDIYPLANSGESEPHAIRFAPSAPQSAYRYAFANICKTSEPHQSVVRLWRGNDDRIGHANFYLPFDANDLAFDPHDSYQLGTAGIVGVARNCSSKKGSRVVLMDMESETCSDYNTAAPRSDSLCIERQGDCFYTGHRNGYLSITDLRTNDMDSFASGDASAGSLTRIMTMKDSNTILTRHSFGSCYLWDVRMMGRECDNGKVSPLLHLQIPKSILHPTKSSCCNGIALDPTQSIVIAPFVNVQERACLAFWSLSSGLFVGYKELSSAVSSGMPYCELSNTITPAWKPMDDSARNGDVLTRKEDGWGLWFKFGMPLIREATPNFLSSIHHVTFPGRIMDAHDGETLSQVDVT